MRVARLSAAMAAMSIVVVPATAGSAERTKRPSKAVVKRLITQSYDKDYESVVGGRVTLDFDRITIGTGRRARPRTDGVPRGVRVFGTRARFDRRHDSPDGARTTTRFDARVLVYRQRGAWTYKVKRVTDTEVPD